MGLAEDLDKILNECGVVPYFNPFADSKNALMFGTYAKALRELRLERENLKMICRRLSSAKTLAGRDKIAKQCHELFVGSPLKKRSQRGNS